LFVERASNVRSDFRLTATSLPAVAEICRQLDGLPLAIELAAAWTRSLSPEQIAARLDDRFGLLVRGSRAAPLRQRTLRATLDWSHALLSDDERALLRRLSVFAGGWTLEAAEAVCDGVARDQCSHVRPSALGMLSGLVEASLVIVAEQDGEARYRLLETVRQYAQEKLREAGEEVALRERHRDWLLELAERAEPELVGPDQVQWLDRLESEHGNLRAALQWCLQRPDAVSGLRFGAALWRFWEGRNRLAEGRAWLDEVLGLEGARADLSWQCRARFAAGRMAFLQGDGEAALRFLEPCLAQSRALGDLDLVASTLSVLGHLSRDRGDLVAARSRYEASLRIWQERRNMRGIARSLLALGRLALIEGAVDQGLALLEESLQRYRELGDLTDITRVLLLLGGVTCDLGRLDQAREHFTEGLRIAARLRDRGRVAANLEGCAVLAAAQRRPERALLLSAMAATLSETTGTVLAVDEQRRLETLIEPIRRALGEQKSADLVEQAHGMTVDEAIAYALGDERNGVSAVTGTSHGGSDWVRLTRRERQVAALIGHGLTNRQIAEELVVSERTVEWHVANSLGKLGFNTRAQLTVWALRHGLAPSSESARA
jgi:DNA-binding NarL/FixJ family response regulator